MATGGGVVTVASRPPLQLSKQQEDSSPCTKTQRQTVALPLHVQTLQRALNLDRLINQVERVLDESLETSRDGYEALKSTKSLLSQASADSSSKSSNNKRRKTQLYNFSHVTEERKWVQDLLESGSDDSGSDLSDTEQVHILLELQHKRKRVWKKRVKRNPRLLRYKHFSAGLLSTDDPFPDHSKLIDEQYNSSKDYHPSSGLALEGGVGKAPVGVDIKVERERYRQKLWTHIVKKEVPKVAKMFAMSRHNVVTNNKKLALLCQREVKKVAAKSQRASKEVSSIQPRARRLMREALTYWKRYERVEKEQRKKAEKEAMEQRRRDDEMREAKKQQRKLNFLITQTELYAHFMAKKLTGEIDISDQILQKLEDAPLQREIRPGMVVSLEQPGDYDSEEAKAKALANVQSAFNKHESTHKTYVDLAGSGGVGGEAKTDLQESFDRNFSLATPVLISDQDIPQPTIFKGKLKAYQLKGMNWLANLYDQGINGILADEMGLGKTVQSIAFLAHLAEHQKTWGPFLIVSPASTLHNWQQECTRFVPRFKVLPYWGSPLERKVIRKYWNQKLLYKENAPFHLLITSYQLVVQDVKYFQRVKWQYMILDEAQAIKSSSSVRWRVLLSFNCRNRLLLTGTPIQNTMQELWALLHFIMPTMFDSHEEFNEWFSRDIESHAEKKSALDESQLSRLHMILKPFMLRRIKRDVEHEMAEKIEVHLSCGLSTRQRKLYHGLRQRISVDDLLQSSASQTSSKDSATSHLLNLVMQFRKVCNHPDLFERRNVISPSSILSIPTYTVPRLVYYQLVLPNLSRHRLLTLKLGVLSSSHIHLSSGLGGDSGCCDGIWAFLKFTDVSPQEASTIMLGSFTQSLLVVLSLAERVHPLYLQRFWQSPISQSRSLSTQLLLWPSRPLSPSSRLHSPTLRRLVFTSHTGIAYAHITQRVYPLKTSAATSAELTEISSTVSDPTKRNEQNDIKRLSKNTLLNDSENFGRSDDKKTLAIDGTDLNGDVKVSNVDVGGVLKESTAGTGQPFLEERCRPCGEYHCVYTDLPKFLVTYSPKVWVSVNPIYCSDRSAEYHRQLWLSGGPPQLQDLLWHGPPGCRGSGSNATITLDLLQPPELGGLAAVRPLTGWAHIQIPDKENMIHDSGKMTILDKLLANLKIEGHRVLVYSQMTRMIDLLEEFMAYRRYKYIRLDGSSRISDRRDMVADFQSNSDIFVFLLSTRAGGLGINLTAADTVIFYDSDWNPTVDQQAMDRAHRLGQTKQVTVYRLIVKGSIEERILQRAREKSEIQKMVISGGDFKPDTLKPKEMVSLLLDDDEMETRFLAKQAEKKAVMDQMLQAKKAKSGKKRKNPPNGRDIEPFGKRPNTGTGIISTTPSPLIFSSRPDSVLSMASNTDTLNGDDLIDVVSTEGTDTMNTSIASDTPSRPGSTPIRKSNKAKSFRDSGGNKLSKSTTKKRTTAPLGGRGKMQRNNKKAASGSAAASAGAIAGALAASNAAYAATCNTYGILPHNFTPSPSNSAVSGSPGGQALTSSQGGGNSAHSSPRVSPVPPAFVATSLVSITPNSGLKGGVKSSLTQSKTNAN